MDDRLVRTINVTDLCQFIGSWTANLQGSSRYAVRTSLDGCDDGCRPLLWPGGMETVRQARSTANYSAFYNGHFDHDPAVQVDNAPGIITAFTSLPRDFSVLDAECVYGGSLSNDSLKVCARQVGQGVAAGKLSLSVPDVHTDFWCNRLGSVSTASQRRQPMRRGFFMEASANEMDSQD